MNYIDLLGYLAAIGTTSSLIPQAYKVFKTKQTKDLSLEMYIFFCAGVIMWIIYGFIINSLPILLANLVTIVLASYILIMKIKNG